MLPRSGRNKPETEKYILKLYENGNFKRTNWFGWICERLFILAKSKWKICLPVSSYVNNCFDL